MNSINLQPENFVLVLSVGGSSSPLIQSIQHYKPGYVIFIASKDSNEKVMEILRQTGGIKKHETITLSDFQNMLDCVRDIREELPHKLDAMNLAHDIPVIADITGGTKVMSAALTLAMMEFNSRFTYVGGTLRTKNGLGIVEDGHETIISMINPWDAICVRESRNLARAFNSGDFNGALANAEIIRSRDTEYSVFYEGLGMVIRAFANWDIFNYSNAKKLLEQGLGRLRAYNNRGHKNFMPLYQKFQDSYYQLVKIADEAEILRNGFKKLDPDTGNLYLLDLVGNAARCAERNHFDDAVARLYSAVEKTVKITLARLGINNSDVPKEIAEKAGEYFMEKYCPAQNSEAGRKESGRIRLPLTDSFLLLCAIKPDDLLAISYKKNCDMLAKTLESRNQSLLAHGYIPVTSTEYQKLFKTVMNFLNIHEMDLPKFPVIEAREIIF